MWSRSEWRETVPRRVVRTTDESAFQPDAFQEDAFQTGSDSATGPSSEFPLGEESQVGVWRRGRVTPKRTGKRYRVYS